MTYKPNYFNFRELPRWKRWLVYGWFQFYVLGLIVTVCDKAQNAYDMSPSGLSMPYITLAISTQLQSNLLHFSVNEDSKLIHLIGAMSETAYQKGVRTLPEADNERYIWYYLRYFAIYPEGYVPKNEITFKTLIRTSLAISNTLITRSGTGQSLDNYKKYRILKQLFLRYVDYYGSSLNHVEYDNEALKALIISFRKDIDPLSEKQLISDDEAAYVSLGSALTTIYIGAFSDHMACDDPVIGVYHYLDDYQEAVMQKLSLNARKAMEAISQQRRDTKVNEIIKEKIGKLCNEEK